MEAALNEEPEAPHDAALADLAERHATTPRKPAREVITEAQDEFATLVEDLDELCRLPGRID
ncbi:hypothetical protein OG912_20285 [Streptomyces sp. NBC_00464]|uniref:hypothetical protein n=1 Tax=Streptomyces sp. NBC_00464 TaxID=2975751 RepID=UPI002E1883C0